MDRAKALSVLHEILGVLQETVTFNQVSLNDKAKVVKDEGGYEIKMQCEFNKESWECVKPLLQKHKLSMKVADGYVILQRE